MATTAKLSVPPGTKFDYIDALRGYAILLVIMTHTSQHASNIGDALRALSTAGKFGVQLFFVVSALTLLLSWHSRSDGPLPFYIRRLFRIAPMFWLAIVFYVLLYGFAPRYWAPEGIAGLDITLAALFLHGWYPEAITSVVPGSWSIAVEMTFYAVFPLLVRYIRSWIALAVAFVCSIVLAKVAGELVYWLLMSYGSERDYIASSFVYLWFFNQLPVFLIGFGAYFALRSLRLVPGVLLFLLIADLATMLLLVFKPFLVPGPVHIKFALCFGVLAVCLGSGCARSTIVNWPIRMLGKISFSAYLWHFAVLDGVVWAEGLVGIDGARDPFGSPVGFVGLFALVVGTTSLLSTVTYNLIEKPMISMGKYRASKLSDRARVNVATAV